VELESLELVEQTPCRASTLVEALDWHVQAHPERPHLILSPDAKTETVVTYSELYQGAAQVACGLQARDIGPGTAVAIMLPTGRPFFEAFFGTLLAGAVPVPIYPPFRVGQLEEHVRRQAGILANAMASILITFREVRSAASLLRALVDCIGTVETVEDIVSRSPVRLDGFARDTNDTALLQYTSGSTGKPKGVVLSHANLLANIRAMGERLEVTSKDIFVSWLPLYHDMGLIGAWLGSLYHAVPAVVLSPLDFLARPERWLWAIHSHRGTLSASPNFGYELCLRRIAAGDIEGLDLSSLRFAANGAEPVSAVTVRRFSERFAPYGLRPEAMAPVYGLAESSVGLTFPPPARPPVIDRVERESLAARGEAVPSSGSGRSVMDVVACGRPLPGHEVRIVDATGRELGERREGRLQFRGASTTSGYFRDEKSTRSLFDGDWLESGDLAYVAGGDVFLTGRSKDLIIRAGRNVYAHELEEEIGEIPGVRKGCVVVFGSLDEESQTERLIVLAETRESASKARLALEERIYEVASGLLDSPPDAVILVPPHTVLKTSSGKIRRAACRELYAKGELGQRRPGPAWQLVRVYWASAIPRLRRARRATSAALYASYWWSLLVSIAAVTWLLVASLPGERLRWAVVRAAARAMLWLSSTPLSTRGLERLPKGAAALAVNHASYVDGLVVIAALRRPATFVAKKELESQLVAGIFLRRIGAVFVERVDVREGAEDTGRIEEALREGRLVVVFPEGTFFRQPGLLPFKLGAFVAAAKTNSPVVPAALVGVRSLLRGGQWFPRHSAVAFSVGEPIQPRGSDWTAGVDLRDAIRARVLSLCGEPDLSAEPESFQHAVSSSAAR
jgi:1-acyl-sn-glycerol-3-phosphate acyltransferase